MNRAIAADTSRPARARVQALRRLAGDLSPAVLRQLVLNVAESIGDAPRIVDKLMAWHAELSAQVPAELRSPKVAPELSPEDRDKIERAKEVIREMRETGQLGPAGESGPAVAATAGGHPYTTGRVEDSPRTNGLAHGAAEQSLAALGAVEAERKPPLQRGSVAAETEREETNRAGGSIATPVKVTPDPAAVPEDPETRVHRHLVDVLYITEATAHGREFHRRVGTLFSALPRLRLRPDQVAIRLLKVESATALDELLRRGFPMTF